MKKQPDVTAQTRQNLTGAFWSLYKQKRIEKITVREITQLAGYNRGTFYEYFLDVYDVLEQLEKSIMPQMPDMPPMKLPAIAGASGMPFPVDAFMKLYETYNEYYTVLLGDNGDSAFMGKIKMAMLPKQKEVMLASGAIDGFELDAVLENINISMIGMLAYWFRLEKKPPVEEFLALMYKIMQGGMLSTLLIHDAIVQNPRC
ncbi:MAG: TetR/AcrR family transcriptional regulator [Eubacteriales bacterium]